MKELSPWRIRRLAESDDIEPNYSYGSQPDEVHLADYWNILVKRRGIIILLFLVAFAPGAYFALTATRLYTASATLKLEPQNPQVTGVGTLLPLDTGWGEYDYYRTQFALLKSRSLAAAVIVNLGLDSNHTFTSSRITGPNPLHHVKSWVLGVLGYFSYFIAPLFQSDVRTDGSGPPTNTLGQGEAELKVAPDLIDRYLDFINIAPIPKTRLVKVEFTTPDPALSQALANAHAQNFMQTSLESRFNLTKEAREFLNQKITELRQKLEISEAALNNFRRAHGVVSVEKGENIVLDRLVDLNKQLTAARTQRIEAESLYRTVENKNYQDLAEVMRQGLVQQLKGNVANLEAEKVRLSTIFKPDHPRIQELVQQIAAARLALNNELANVVRGIQSSYAAALAKERGLQAEANKQQQDALKLKELGVNYTILQEEVNANRSLYDSVLKRLSETNVSNDIALSNIQIAERAVKPLDPSSPNVPLYLLASLISGLFFGVGVAFLQEFLDSTVATPDDVWRSVGLSTLGVVPHFKFLNRRTYKGGQIGHVHRQPEASNPLTHAHGTAKDLIISHSPISIMSESYRTIRTSLLLSQAEKAPQVVLLTSPAPGEGKTVTTLNLSIALAQDGYSVLVIDADMRKGCCHARLGLQNNKGLSNVLTGGLSLQEGTQPTSVSGLSLLSRGIVPPNPNELLGSRKMREILQELRQTFKFILIDSPPVIAVSDAAVLSGLSDGVLLVYDAQKTSTVSAQKAVERLDMVRAHCLGVVLNAVNLDDPHYSYYRTYCSYYRLPNEDERINEANGNNSDQAVHKFYNLSKIAQRWSKKERPKATDTTANNESVKDDRANGWQSAARVRSAGEIDEPDVLEPVNTRSTDVAKEPFSEDDHRATLLSDESLNRLIEALTKAIGPIAPLIIREQITILGESRYAFPKKRIGELLKSIQGEITQDELVRFKLSIPDEFRNLDTQ